MQLHEFENQVKRLKIVYGEKTFPPEREGMFWKRFQRVPGKAFELAVDWVVLTMPPPGQVVVILDDKLRDAKVERGGDTQREIQYQCSKCRDFGYLWSQENEHLIVHCTCPKHHEISFKELEKQQINYDRGRKLLKKRSDLSGFIGRGA